MNIDSISNNIRTFLLSKNILSNTIEESGLSSLVQSTIGTFANISSTTPNIKDSPTVEDLGDYYLPISIINNTYQPSLDQYSRISINYTPTSFKKTIQENYIDTDHDLLKKNKKFYEDSLIKNKFSSSIPEYEAFSINPVSNVTENLKEYDQSDSHLIQNSKEYLKFNIVKNKFVDFTKQTLTSIDLTPTSTIENTTNYLDDTFEIFQNIKFNAASVINGILGGLLPNFSVGSTNPVFSYEAMINGSVNEKKDTKLGIIAAHGLSNAIRANTSANIYEETVGNINGNPLSLISGGPIWLPNYSITVAKGTFGTILDYAEKIMGFNTPVSLLSVSSSIFDKENPVSVIMMTNSLISNSGKGQVSALMFNANANMLNTSEMKMGYSLSYTDDRDETIGVNGDVYILKTNDGGFVDMLHGSDNNPISQSNYNLDGMISDSGFDSLKNHDINADSDDGSESIDFIWGIENRKFNRKSLLGKTEYLFSKGKNKMKTLINDTYYLSDKSEVNSSAIDVNGKLYSSKGSAVIKYNGLNPETNPEKMFFRVFTKKNKYDKVNDLQKHSSINYNAGTNIRNGDGGFSVLEDTGFVKITPYANDTDVKKYMFSIENLAWNDNLANLIPEEVGNGDTVTGKKGRIMWFPPYDINFTDNTSNDIERTSMIGRGEPVYTYNNTTRTGTLDFKIIVDHPAYLNNLQGEDDALITSFFAGGFDIDKRVRSRLSINEEIQLDIEQNKNIDEIVYTPQQPPASFTIYFPYGVNADIALDDILNSGYESGTYPDGTDIDYNISPDGYDTYGPYTTTDDITYYSNTNFGLNSQLNITNQPSFITTYSEGINQQCPACKVIITYYGQSSEADSVIEGRADAFIDFFESQIVTAGVNGIGMSRYKKVLGELYEEFPTTWTAANTQNQKTLRKIVVSFEWDPSLAEKISPIIKDKIPDPISPENVYKKLKAGIKSRYYSEKEYFQKIQDTDKFAFDSLRQKINFFHPSFHSITPEGFNSRLTFLQQCMRQGPTYSIPGINTTQNLAFGDAPICILRIGDFYNTKIIIESLNFSFEPLVWDMNPEGIGVQPMICNVTMSFAFIGGSSLAGPISRLQNAVSFNYFANTSIYDVRSDTIKNGMIINGDKNVDKITDSNIVTNTNDNTDQVKQSDLYNGPKTPPINQ